MRCLYRFQVPRDNVRVQVPKTDLDSHPLFDSISTKDEFVEWLLSNRPRQSSTQLSRLGFGTVCPPECGYRCYGKTRSKFRYHVCTSHRA
jgi:hypothetical protein